MPRNHHGLRRIVDDQIDARRRFQRANIAPFAADDLSLQFIVGQRENRHRALRDKVAGEPLDRQSDNLLAFANRLFFGFFFDHANAFGRFMLGLLDHLIDKAFLGLLAGHARDLSQLPSRFVDLPVAFGKFVLKILFPRLERLLPAGKFAIALVHRLDPFIDSFFFADQPFFLILQFPASLAHLLFELGSLLEHTIFGVDFGFFFDRASVFFRFFDNPRGAHFAPARSASAPACF